MTVPVGWQRVVIGPGVEFAVPPDAKRAEAIPIDSIAGYLSGEGYRITFDLGRFAEKLEVYEEERDFIRNSRNLGGRAAIEVGFAPSDEPFAWTRCVQVNAGDRRTLTICVSCDRRESCDLAEQVFNTVRLG